MWRKNGFKERCKVTQMKTQIAEIECSVCGHKIAETENLNISPVELAKKCKLAEIEIRTHDMKEKAQGYLCSACFNLLFFQDSLKRIVKQTVERGNSSCVILPRKWLNKKVIVYLLDTLDYEEKGVEKR